jgi:beta-glucuronidase
VVPGTPETANVTHWKIDYQKPLIVSELGAGTKAGLHGSENERWAEEYQTNIFRHQLPMLKKITQLRGMSPWCLIEFPSPNRPLAGIQDEFNRKGLISDQVQKKEASRVLEKAHKEGTIGKAE